LLKIAYSKLSKICPETAVKVHEDRRRLKAEKPAKSKLSTSALRAIKALPTSMSQLKAAKKRKMGMDAKVLKARCGNGKIRRWA
jgi:hypothetical protein